MKASPILTVNDISKSYPETRKAARERLVKTLKSAVSLRPRSEIAPQDAPNWAISNLSFSVGRGEAVGVIGRNGAGKTTLLRMLAGQLRPDRGEIIISGASAALIALQAGLKPSSTGRQNIYLKSATIGRSRQQTQLLEHDIIAFSELGEAIDRPVETYSSGMVVRLAFSIILASRPNLLIVDETLAVGDFAFKQKCLDRIRSLKNDMGLVLVSHSMGDISRFCDQVIVLEKGIPIFRGAPDEAIKYYHDSISSAEVEEPKNLASSLIPAVVNRPEVFELIDKKWTDASGVPLKDGGYASVGHGIGFECRFILHRKPRRLALGVPIYSQSNELLCGLSTDGLPEASNLPLHKTITARFTSPHLVLNPGRYRAALGVVDELEHLYMDELPDLQIASAGALTWGHFSWPGRWTIE